MAIALCKLGHTVGWISKVGNDPFGEYILSTLKGEGVDISEVKKSNRYPTGVFFKEKVGMEETNVYYYRNNSAAAHLLPSDITKKYFSNSKILHISGITAAISESTFDTLKYSIKLAKELGLTICFDPNIRLKLWEPIKAKRILLDIIKDVDICLPGLNEAKILTEEQDPIEQSRILRGLGPKIVVIKLEEKGAYYHSESEFGFVDAFKVNDIVDSIGAGDGFAAGFLSGFLNEGSIKDSVKLGCAIGAYSLTTYGDFEGYPTKEEVINFINNSRRVSR